MKTDPEKLRTLLDEVLPSSADHCGPSSAGVLHLLRSERRRRRHLLTSATMLAIAAAALLPLLWQGGAQRAPVAPAMHGSAPLAIRNVNDEQLFALLQGTPTALMESPDGQRILFVIER
jgi:hypothetical protein